jgi:hypothetical protein
MANRQQAGKDRFVGQEPFRASAWRRFRRFWKGYQWPILVGTECALLVLGYVGFAKYTAALGQFRSPLDLLYLTLQLVTMESGAVSGPVGWELQVARLALPAVSAYTALAAFAALFRRQIESFRLWFTRGHVVICGLGQKGTLLARRFLREGRRVVVIEQDDGNDQLGPCREGGAFAIVGDARSEELLRKAGTSRARWLIAVCGDDGVNAEIAVRARPFALGRLRGALTCVVHIVNPQLCALLRECEISREQDAAYRLELFNVFDRGAQTLLREHPPQPQETHAGCAPHMVIVGLGGLGKSLVVHAARDWWNQHGTSEPRMRISAIDREARWKCASIETRYPQLAEACDLVPYPIDVRWPAFQEGSFLYDAQGTCTADAIYVCLDDDSLGLQAGLTLLQRTRTLGTPIVIRVAQEAGLALLLQATDSQSSTFGDLHAFALVDHTCTTALVRSGTHEVLARAIHGEYLRTQREAGRTLSTHPALRPWHTLPERFKESNRRQADHIGVKLQAVGYETVPLTRWDAAQFQFTPQEIERMAQMEHARWSEELRHEGWSYAPGPRDDAQKTHAALLTWNDLPEEEKEKNRAVVRELPAFLARAGLEIRRC